MQKVIRGIFTLVGSLAFIVLAIVITLVVFVNPNNYKPQISQQVYQHTGRKLSLNGDIDWTFFPTLGVRVNQLQLSNAPGFGDQPFLQIKQAKINVKLLPLLQKKVEVSTLFFDGLQLNLMKNANGTTNWQDLLDRFNAKKQVTSTNASATTTPNTTTNTPIDFAVARINIENGDITWLDQQNTKSFEIRQLYLDSKNIKLAQNFPLVMQFNFNSKQPELTGAVQVKSQIIIDPALNSYLVQQSKINIQVNSELIPSNKLTIDSNGDLVINSKQSTLNISQLTAYTNNATITGNIQATNLLTAPVIQGQFNSNRVTYDKFNVTNVAIPFNIQNNVITLNPVTAQLYQGNYIGNTSINLTGKTPKITTDAQLTKIQAQPLFHDLTDITHVQLAGTADATIHFTMQGATEADIIKSLNGQGKFALNNGVLNGINLSSWIDIGKALVKKQTPPTPTGPNQTDFGTLTGTFTTKNGVIHNDDLLLQGNDWQAKGTGTANLVNELLEYQFTLQSVTSTNQPQGMAVPIVISGPFDNIKIRPSVKAILNQEITVQLDKQKNKIGDFLQKNLGKDTGAKIQNQLKNLFGQ